MKILLDSVILIDHTNQIVVASDYLRSIKHQAVISPISQAEVLSGIEPQEEAQALSLLREFELISIHREDANQAASLRREFGWKLPDAFQAAIAMRHGFKLATRNFRDFDPAKHDFVVLPYRL